MCYHYTNAANFVGTQLAGRRCGWLLTYTAALSKDSRHHAASTSTGFASDFRRTRRHPNQPRNFTALRRYVGRIRFFIHSRSQPNNYYSSCRFRTAHRKDHFCRLTLRAAARQGVTPIGADGRIRTCDFPSSRFALRSGPLPRLRYVCGWVPRHIPLWRRGGSLVLLWRWVTPFSRQPRRFSRCPIVGWTGRRASLPCYDTRTRTPTGGLEVSVGIGPTTCSLRMSCSAS